MALNDARRNIGRAVVYTAPDGSTELGFITGVGQMYAFVRYGSNQYSTATPPKWLKFEN